MARKQMTRARTTDDGTYHSLDEPSIIMYDDSGNVATEIWCYNGSLHRLKGPAYIDYIKPKKEVWVVNGVIVDKSLVPFSLDEWPISEEKQMILKLIMSRINK